MKFSIIKAGVLDTVQDLGRYGFMQYGINPGGAMDKTAMQLANIIACNAPGDAALELHFPASTIFFHEPAVIALTGADMAPTINGEPINNFQPVLINKDDVLQFKGRRSGVRTYLAVHGAIDAEEWLGSYSTNIKAGKGGYKGRKLLTNDVLSSAMKIHPSNNTRLLHWKANEGLAAEKSAPIRLIEGHEWNSLEDLLKHQFLTENFRIGPRSDRMGIFLEGKPLLKSSKENEMVSSAVAFGTIQLLPGGMPLILGADHQTTGGYPRIAHVITADHSRLAQLVPGDTINFKMVSLKEAEDEMVRQKVYLQQLSISCQLKYESFFL